MNVSRRSFLSRASVALAGVLAVPLIAKAKEPRDRGCFVFSDELDKAFVYPKDKYLGGYSIGGRYWQRWAPIRDNETHEIRGFIYSDGHWKTNCEHVEARAVWFDSDVIEVLGRPSGMPKSDRRIQYTA